MTPESAVKALAALVAPPAVPTRPMVVDWAEFAQANGFKAPTDYRLLTELYGVGGFGTEALQGGWIYLLDPFAPTLSLVEMSEWDRRNSRGMQRRFPDQFPAWPIWPEAGGLLPWANTADGDLVGWWTVGDPDQWGTRFFGRDVDYEEFAFGAAEFILRLLAGTLGAASLDGRFTPLEAGEALTFFPTAADAAETGGPVRENVTVVFAGLASVIDPATLPSRDGFSWHGHPAVLRAQSMEYFRLWDEAMRPGDDIIQAWRVGAAEAGFFVGGVGTASTGDGDPIHHEISGSFDPANEAIAKELALDLSKRLGVAIVEVRNLENTRIWRDITTRG